MLAEVPVPPLDSHVVLVFWCQLVVLLAAARALGHVSRRLGQPRVVGELLAGVVLGPSLLGRLWPDAMEWLFPADETQSGLLIGTAWIGVVLLLAVTGAETDITALSRRGRAALTTATGSLVVPLAAGAALGAAVPASFLGSDGRRGLFVAFIAVALSISSLPVAARILAELGVLRAPFAQLTLGAAVANDVVGWLALGVVAGMTEQGSISLTVLALTIAGLVAFFVGSIMYGPRVVDVALRELRRREGGPAAALSVAVLAVFAAGALTHLLGVEAVLGAFVAGMAIGRSRLRDVAALHHVEVVTLGVFAPLFFAIAGLRVDLSLLATPSTLAWTVVVVAVATAAKVIGAAVGGRVGGMAWAEGLAVGAGLNARGALEVVVATVGLSIGVLNQESYTVIVVMALVTSMSTAPLLRLVLRHSRLSPTGTGVEPRPRALDPERPVLVAGVTATDMAESEHLARFLWPDSRLRTLGVPSSPEPALVPAGAPSSRSITLDARNPASTIVAESVLGHRALVLADAGPGPDVLTSPYDEVLRGTSLPTLVLRLRHPPDGRRRTPERVLVPISGSLTSDAALDVAAVLAASTGAVLTLAHVVAPPQPGGEAVVVGGRSATLRSRWHRAVVLLESARQTATAEGVTAVTRLVTDPAPAAALANLATGHDLVVVGVRRRVSGATFFGYVADEMVRSRLTDVLLVVAPAT